jgi:hypothetical protein
MGKALLAYSDPYFTPTEQQDLAELAGLSGDEGEVSGDSSNDGEGSETDVDLDETEVSDEAASEEVDTDEGDEIEAEADEADDESDVAQVSQSDDSTADSDTSNSSTTSWTETSSNESDSSLDDSTELTTDSSPESSASVTDEGQDTEETSAETSDETSDEAEVSQEDSSHSDDEIEDTSEEFSSSSPAAEPKPLDTPTRFEFAKEDQPVVGVIDTGFAADNPDLDYDNITLGKDVVDGDDNPLLAEGEGNEHGTHILGIIAAQQDNGEGIDGINDDAPIWLGRGVGSGKWAESLVEFVDHAKDSGQPNAVVNLSMDLIQVNEDGSVTTRYEFTPQERAAIEYARQNDVMLVVAAGNDSGVMSALGQASQEFDNIITVGAAEQFDPNTSVWKGSDRVDYSSYGHGLDIVAPGGTIDNPIFSTTGNGIGTMAGTSVATSKVTGTISQVWAANPELSYRQVIEIVKNTATDLNTQNWDMETGAGLINGTAAVFLAKATKSETHDPEPFLIPTTWGGEKTAIPGERAVDFAGKILNVGDVNTTGWLRVRSEPSLNGNHVTKIPVGTELVFDLVETNGGLVTDYNGYGNSRTWYRLADGRGWMSALYIEQLQDSGSDTDSTPDTDSGSDTDSTPDTEITVDGVFTSVYKQRGWELGSPIGNVIEDNGTRKQYFENGHIFWNGVASNVVLSETFNLEASLTPKSLPIFEFALHTASVGDFTGKVMYTGVNVRSGAGVNNTFQGRFAPNTSVTFNAWAYGTTHWDPIAKQNDNRWFRIKSGQYAGKWVASAFINGNPNSNTPQIGGSASGTDFSGKSMGVNVRGGPGVHHSLNGYLSTNSYTTFDAWAYGTSHKNPVTGQLDNKWFRIKSGQHTGKWVSGAYIYGQPKSNTPRIDGGSNSGQYNRQAAINYAQQYWNTSNPEYYFYSGNNCANFVSQCLVAGGLFPKYATPAIGNYSFTSVLGLNNYLLGNNLAEQVAIGYLSSSSIQQTINNLQPGDVILHDWAGDGYGGWQHCDIYLGNGQIASNTNNRLGNIFNLRSGQTKVKILRISS